MLWMRSATGSRTVAQPSSTGSGREFMIMLLFANKVLVLNKRAAGLKALPTRCVCGVVAVYGHVCGGVSAVDPSDGAESRGGIAGGGG